MVIKRNDLRRGVHNGDRATVVAVDTDRRALEVHCDGRRVTLDARFLLGETADGEPTLLHGYAITAHVAQGSTVDRAYVLAEDDLSSEWAYTAMSRGREQQRALLRRGRPGPAPGVRPGRRAAARGPRTPHRRAGVERGVSARDRHRDPRRARAQARRRPRARTMTAAALPPGEPARPRGLARADLMTAKQVAELLDVPVSTVREWGRNGTLPRVKLGRHVRFLRSRVEAAIVARREPARLALTGKLVLHPGPAPADTSRRGDLENEKSPANAGLSSYSGGRIRTCDLRVMSPTSYLAAPPRVAWAIRI